MYLLFFFGSLSGTVPAVQEFGDPAVSMSAGGRPTAGINGNWSCDKCGNVNYPRR